MIACKRKPTLHSNNAVHGNNVAVSHVFSVGTNTTKDLRPICRMLLSCCVTLFCRAREAIADFAKRV